MICLNKQRVNVSDLLEEFLLQLFFSRSVNVEDQTELSVS